MKLKQRILNWWRGMVEVPRDSLIIKHLVIDDRDQLIGPVPADFFVYGESPELQCGTLSAGKRASVEILNSNKFAVEVTMGIIGRTDVFNERVVIHLGRKVILPGALVEFAARTDRDMVPYRLLISYPTHVRKS
jgi:hypothetical protein